MKKALLILFVAVASLTACKKDKNENKLEGRWDKTKEYSLEYTNGVKTDEESEAWEPGEFYIIFKGNNYEAYADGVLESSGTFTATENSITTKSNKDGDNDTISLRWNSKNEFVTISEYTYTDNGKTYREVEEETFKKH